MEEKILYWDDMEVGRVFQPYVYTLTKETIKKYAEAVEDENPIYVDEEMAKNSGYEGIIGHPTTCAIYFLPSWKTEGKSPAGNIHARQSFEFIKPVRAGDTLITQARVIDKYKKKERKYVVIEVISKNQHGEIVVRGKMTGIWAK